MKKDLLDGRMRLNADVFVRLQDLQSRRPTAACLCNITDNSRRAPSQGRRSRVHLRRDRTVLPALAGSYVMPLRDFIESAINPTTGQRLCSS